jgi:predicted AAA+ superfamily ATPase
MPERLRPWFEVVRLHPDVEAGRLAMATFAIDFGGVLANSEGVPLVYRDSRSFWQATHLTGGIRRLLEEVLDRLSGRAGDRVLQLRSPFGGGKSHVLVALYHAAKDRKALEEGAPDCKSLPNPGKVQIAGIDGEKFDPTVGRKIDGTTVHTLWGALGAQLGCFDLVREHEKGKTAPAGDPVKGMLGDKRVLILFDEVLQYVERAMTIPVGESNLGRQTLEFLQTLTTEVANSTKAVMVYSLQASTREALDNIGLLTMLDHLAARVDAKREPVVGDEILDVLKKRLLSEPPPSDVAKQVATAIAQSVTQWKMAEAPDNSARRAAEDEKVRLARRLETAYPFHVGLIDLMKERWASIPDFQRTRGALRFLAAVLHKAKKLTRQSVFVCPGDIPIDDADVRNAFFTEVGQREPFQAVLEHDFIGANARVKRIDNQIAEQNPALASVRPAMSLATTILMYSFGGLPREEKGEPLPSGVSERELLEVCLSVEIDNLTAQSVLKRLMESIIASKQ